MAFGGNLYFTALDNASTSQQLFRTDGIRVTGKGNRIQKSNVFLQTLDNRKRSFDKDSRATVTAPPKPDPTAANGRGFTGMEGIWRAHLQ